MNARLQTWIGNDWKWTCCIHSEPFKRKPSETKEILITTIVKIHFLRVIFIVGIIIFSLGLQSLNGQINADFSSPNLEACGSLQTTFFDQSNSENSIISWAWDLGGNTSSKQNPGSIFTEPGQYTICLTVTDVDGNSDTECKEDYITILPKNEPPREN